MRDAHPTLMRIPGWHSELTPDEVALPLPPTAYVIAYVGTCWRVTIHDTSELIYAGNGPVEIVASHPPF